MVAPELTPGGSPDVTKGETFTIAEGQTTPATVTIQTSTECYSVNVEVKSCENPLVSKEHGYVVYKEDNGSYTAITTPKETDATGKVTVDKLTPGNYLVAPELTPGGLPDVTKGKTFTIADGQSGTTTVQIVKDCPPVAPSCDKFELQVTVDGVVLTEGTKVTLIDGVTVIPGTVGATGVITFAKADLNAGTYTVKDENQTLVYGMVTVNYKQDCKVEVLSYTTTPAPPAYNVNITLDACAQNNPKTTTLDIYKDGVKVDTVNLDGNGQGSIKVSDLREGVYVAIPMVLNA